MKVSPDEKYITLSASLRHSLFRPRIFYTRVIITAAQGNVSRKPLYNSGSVVPPRRTDPRWVSRVLLKGVSDDSIGNTSLYRLSGSCAILCVFIIKYSALPNSLSELFKFNGDNNRMTILTDSYWIVY